MLSEQNALMYFDRYCRGTNAAFPARDVSVQASNKSAANLPVKSSAPKGPARMVLVVTDGCHWKRAKRSGRESTQLHVENGSTEGPKDLSTPARGRRGDSSRIAPGSVPVLRDELAAVVTIHRYPPERFPRDYRLFLVVSALASMATCWSPARLLAQQRDDGSDRIVVPNDVTKRGERGPTFSSPQATEANSASELTKRQKLTKEQQKPAKLESETNERNISRTKKPQLSWKPAWPRHSLVEYLAIPVLGITALTVLTQVDNPHHARIRGGFLFDRPMQDLLRLSSRDGRSLARSFSDVGFFGLQFYPLVIDILLVSLLIHEIPDVALELTIMTAQAFAISHTLVVVSQKLVGRERPYSERCDSEGDASDPGCNGSERYTSFLSGHTLSAFTGAGLICAQHQALDLYGGGAVETVACGAALTVASLTGVLRVMSDRHWFSDVLTSAAVGLASGWLMPWLLHFQFDTSDTQNSAFNNGIIVPLLDDDVTGIGYFTVF